MTAASLTAIAFTLCVTAVEGQAPPAPTVSHSDAKGFKEFTEHVQKYVTLLRSAEAGVPALAPTDRPEQIAERQQLLASKIKEARRRAKEGDLFTSDVQEAFRHVSAAALGGPKAARSRAYMKSGEADPAMLLAVNGTYPDTQPVTSFSPVLLAIFPVLPDGLTYRAVGRTLILFDVKSHLIVDIARLVLPPPS